MRAAARRTRSTGFFLAFVPLELEILPYTAVYGPQRAAGAITMSKIDISLPVANTG